jgi:hypothetical protein
MRDNCDTILAFNILTFSRFQGIFSALYFEKIYKVSSVLEVLPGLYKEEQREARETD